MAIITDAELEAGFQVRVRWYAQGTQRYPSNENEYYSTFFTTLEPNETFSLSDPRFVLANINDNPTDLNYIVRDVCHTQTLIPQFVDFIYINPDYLTYTRLNGRVDGGSTTITVDANPDPNFPMGGTLATGNVIQIGPIQSDVYTIGSVSGTTITLTTATTKSFPTDTVVSLSNVVDGRYPDTVAETALARILDNTGSLQSDPLEVTTPLYFDIGETVRRYYYDSALQTPFNGARGSGETTNLTVADPRTLGAELEGGWWSAGDVDNTAASRSLLIDSEGFEIGQRDMDHAFQQILYFAERETEACTAQNPTIYLADHPDFTDTNFTSIRNDDVALSLPSVGFYAWGSPTIVFGATIVTFTWGDNQFFPGTGDPVVGDLTFTGQISGNNVEFTVPTGATNSGAADRWEVLRSELTATTGLGAAVAGLVENVGTTNFATNRFVRYWSGEAFDTGRVDPTAAIDNCPTALSNSVEALTYDTQQNAACNNSGVSRTLYYLTVDSQNTNFVAGNVSQIFTDRFGPNSDSPSSLGVGYIRANNTVFFWNGNSLSIDNTECTARYCNMPNALNFQNLPGGIVDNSTCVYPRRICTDSSATNFTPLSNRVGTDIDDNSVCTYPQPILYSTNVTVVNNISGPSTGYSISGRGRANHTVGSNWSRTVSVSTRTGFEFTSGPNVSYSPGSSGSGLAEGQTQAITATITGTVQQIPDVVLDPESATYVYGTSAEAACSLSGSLDSRTLFWANGVAIGVGVSVFTNSALTSEAPTGWYTFALQTLRVTGGIVTQGFTACPVAPPPATFAVPGPFSTTSASSVRVEPGATVTIPISPGSNPDNLAISYQFVNTRSDLFQIVQRGNAGVSLRATSTPVRSQSSSLIITGVYTNPNTGASVSYHTITITLETGNLF